MTTKNSDFHTHLRMEGMFKSALKSARFGRFSTFDFGRFGAVWSGFGVGSTFHFVRFGAVWTVFAGVHICPVASEITALKASRP